MGSSLLWWGGALSHCIKYLLLKNLSKILYLLKIWSSCFVDFKLEVSQNFYVVSFYPKKYIVMHIFKKHIQINSIILSEIEVQSFYLYKFLAKYWNNLKPMPYICQMFFYFRGNVRAAAKKLRELILLKVEVQYLKKNIQHWT